MDDDGITDDMVPMLSAAFDLYFQAVADWEAAIRERKRAIRERNSAYATAGFALMGAGTVVTGVLGVLTYRWLSNLSKR
jgi:hypothetical protein